MSKSVTYVSGTSVTLDSGLNTLKGGVIRKCQWSHQARKPLFLV